MNNLKLFLTGALLLLTFSAYAQSVTDTIKVYGNCHTCEKHIEKAAKAAGASKARWNMDTKMLVVTYDESSTSNDAIQKKIASVGYDTEKYTGDNNAYNKLDKCCKYDRK